MQELISVIVPVYNVEKYIHKCVDSILAQTYTNLEIILVDDGSPDNCPAILDEYAKRDSRIKVVHKENGGLSSARNAGLDIATGDYIGFVDSDDYIALDMYEYLHRLIKDYNVNVGQIGLYSVGEDYKVIDKESVAKEVVTIKDAQEYIQSILEYRGAVSACAGLFEANFIGRYRFKEKLLNEDLIFSYSLFVNGGRIAVSSEKKYYYYCNTSSTTRVRFSKAIKDCVDNAIYIYNNIHNRGIEELYKSAEHLVMRQISNYLYRIPRELMSNEHCQYVLKYLKEHKDMVKNDLLGKKQKLILRAYLISPKMAKRLTDMYYGRKR